MRGLPEGLAGEVFLGRAALAEGVVTPRQLLGPGVRRLMRGVYADARLPVDHQVMCRAALLAASAGAVVAGRSAAWLHGATCGVRRGDPVVLVCPPTASSGSRAEVRIRRFAIGAGDVTRVAGLPVTTVVRSAWDVAAGDPLDVAVPVLDQMLHRRILRLPDLETYAAARGSVLGSTKVRRALRHVDGRAESPPESTMRLALMLAGLNPEPQYDVVDGVGTFVARVDLAFAEHRLAVEYDGAHHGEAAQFVRDRRRLNGLSAAGWEAVFVTAPDLYDLPGVVARVQAALLRRGAPPTSVGKSPKRRL